MRTTSPGYLDITPDAAYRLRSQARLVDVRAAEELAADGFIAGSQHVPLADLGLKARTWELDDELVVICRSGKRSAMAANLLVQAGFSRVMNMTGGMVAYQAEGFPVSYA